MSLRALAAGTPLISVPERLFLQSSKEDRQTIFLGTTSANEQLSHMLARGLNDRHCVYQKYLEFLHDLYNFDAGEDGSAIEHDDSTRDDLDSFTMGNALVMRGEMNIAYLDKECFTSPRYRVEWVRWRRFLRELEQSLPHFASQSSSWALSMVLSRAIATDDGEKMLIPLVDMLNHYVPRNKSCERLPTAHYYFSLAEEQPKGSEELQWKSQQPGVGYYDSTEPHCHVLAVRDIAVGEEVTLHYSDKSNVTDEERDFWIAHWGFVPKRIGNKHGAPTIAELDALIQKFVPKSVRRRFERG